MECLLFLAIMTVFPIIDHNTGVSNCCGDRLQYKVLFFDVVMWLVVRPGTISRFILSLTVR